MKRKRYRKPTLAQRIETLEMAVASMRKEFHLMTVIFNSHSLQRLFESVQFCDTSINSMANNLQGVEIAIAKLIPKETLENWPQFRDVPVAKTEQARLITGYLL